jgi:hypothetical protein
MLSHHLGTAADDMAVLLSTLNNAVGWASVLPADLSDVVTGLLKQLGEVSSESGQVLAALLEPAALEDRAGLHRALATLKLPALEPSAPRSLAEGLAGVIAAAEACCEAAERAAALVSTDDRARLAGLVDVLQLLERIGYTAAFRVASLRSYLEVPPGAPLPSDWRPSGMLTAEDLERLLVLGKCPLEQRLEQAEAAARALETAVRFAAAEAAEQDSRPDFVLPGLLAELAARAEQERVTLATFVTFLQIKRQRGGQLLPTAEDSEHGEELAFVEPTGTPPPSAFAQLGGQLLGLGWQLEGWVQSEAKWHARRHHRGATLRVEASTGNALLYAARALSAALTDGGAL